MIKRPMPEDYAPYHTYHAFQIGVDDYLQGRGFGPHHYRGVDEQAYDRGAEYAMQLKSWFRKHVWKN